MHDTGKRWVLAALLCMWFLTACSDSGNKSYTISGIVYSAAGNFADSDINDIMAEENIPNNSIEEAQELTSPAVVGGYVNLRGEGDPGLTHEEGDPVDFFAVRLTAGEVVQLVLPDRSTAEIGLYLYDAAGELVASAPDVAPAAALSAESAGDHYIEVRARAGAGAYRLMIGWPAALVAPAAFDPAAEFVPDEVLVRMKTGGVARMPSRHRAASLADDLEMQLLSSGREGWMRLRMPRVRRTLERLNIPAPDDARHLSGRARIQAQRRDTWRVVQALRHHPDVAHAQPNFIRRPLFIPDDPLFRYQWNHTLINLPAAWDLTRGSAEVIVAVLDTGILMEHPDLRNQLVGGYDFISDPARAADGDGIDGNPSDPGDHPVSGSYHGTHIAGIIAAETDNGIGLAGVGGDTRIMPVRVLGRGGGTDKDIARALLWAAGFDIETEDRLIQGAYPRADIINMSFGGAGAVDPEKDVLAQAVAEARAAGVIVIAAAGNEAANSAFYPAAYDGVVSVGAVDAAGRRTPYSNFGAHLDLMAPGGDRYTDLEPDGYADSILSTLGAKGGLGMNYFYGYMEGTSMSAAHVSGVAALMKAVRPGLDPDQFQLYIEGKMITADLGAEHLYGYGLIDAHQAVATAMETDPPPAISVIPRAVRLDAFESTAALYVREVGAGGLILQGPTVEPDWLSAAYVEGQGGFGRYTLSVDRLNRNLAGGVHTGTVSFTFYERTVTVPVTVDVLPDRAASAAPQYIHLIDARTNAIVDHLVVLPRHGAYPFSFSRVSPGSYYLRSSSDINNDYRFKDQGEAVGAYPSLAGPRPFTVKSSMTGLDFVTGFQQWPFLEPAEQAVITKRRR